MRQNIYVGLHLAREGVVDLFSERRVAVKRRIALQQRDTRRQERRNGGIAAIDIRGVDVAHLQQCLQDICHERTPAQRPQVLARDAAAVQTYGYECYGLHSLGLCVFVTFSDRACNSLPPTYCTSRLQPRTSAPVRRPSMVKVPSAKVRPTSCVEIKAQE